MSRLKVKRFRVKEPPLDVLAFYSRLYHSRQMHYDPDSLPLLSPELLFGQPDPIVLDLGCGRGDFLTDQAAQHPDVNYAGFDYHEKSIWDAIRKAHRAGLHNVRLVRCDLRHVMPKIPDGAAREAFMLFPPPVLTAQTIKKDMLTGSMIEHLHRVLIADGMFHLVTDSEGYFEAKRALLESSGRFEVLSTSCGFEGGLTWFQRMWEGFEVESLRIACRRR